MATQLINVQLEDDEHPKTVNRAHYVKAKTRALREFGYSNLTEGAVNEQLQAVLDGGSLRTGELDIIGSFIANDNPTVTD